MSGMYGYTVICDALGDAPVLSVTFSVQTLRLSAGGAGEAWTSVNV